MLLRKCFKSPIVYDRHCFGCRPDYLCQTRTLIPRLSGANTSEEQVPRRISCVARCALGIAAKSGEHILADAINNAANLPREMFPTQEHNMPEEIFARQMGSSYLLPT